MFGLCFVVIVAQAVVLTAEAQLASPFLDAFLREAVWRSNLDWTIHLGPHGAATIKGYKCSDFVSRDIEFKGERLAEGHIEGQSSFAGLGMNCELEVDLSSYARPIVAILKLSNGEWKTNLRFSCEQNRLMNVTLDKCETRFVFDPSSISIKGLPLFPTAILHALYRAMAPMIGPKMADPMMCNSLGLMTETMNAGVQVVRSIIGFSKAPKHAWPSVHFIERQIRPKSSNSSLLFRPYDESLPLRIVSGVLNDVLGIYSSGKLPLAKNLVVNKVIREKLANRGGAIDIEDLNLGIGFTMMDVALQILIRKVTITNLDTFSKFVLLRPISDLTWQNVLAIDGPVQFGLDMSIQLTSSTGEVIEAPLTLKGAFEKLEIRAWLLFAIDERNLMRLSWDHLLPCLVASIAALEFPKTQLIVQGGQVPRFAAPDENEPLGALLQSFMEAYVWPFAQGFSQQDVDTLMRDMAWFGSPLLTTMTRMVRSCPETPTVNATGDLIEPHEGFVRFDSLPVTVLARFLNDFMAPSDDPDFSISRVLEIVADVVSLGPKTEQPPAESNLDGIDDEELEAKHAAIARRKRRDGMITIERSVTFGPYSLLKMFPSLADGTQGEDEPPSLELSVGNLTIGPLDDIASTALFVADPNSPYAFKNGLVTNQKRPFDFRLDFRMSLKGMLQNGKAMTPAFHLQAAFWCVDLDAEVFTRMNPVALLKGLSMEHMISSCVSFAFPANQTVRIESLALRIKDNRFRLACQDGPCKLESTRRFTERISSPEGTQQLLEFLLKGAEKVAKVLSGEDTSYFDGFNVPLGTDRLLREMKDECKGIPRSVQEPVRAPSWIPPMNYFMLISALGLVLQFAVYMYYVQRTHRRIRMRQSGRLLQSPLLYTVEGATSGSTSAADLAAGGGETSGVRLNNDDATDSDEDNAADIVPGNARRGLALVSESSPLARWLDRRVGPKHLRALLFGLVGSEDTSGEGAQDALYLLGLSKPLVRHPAIHWSIRYGIALGLLANFCIFVIGVSFFTMGTITILAQFGEERLKPIPMMSLTLDACIDMMVEGRALLFALFIGVSSGVFPWIRVAVLAFVWLAPPTILPVDRRERLVENLEGAGKWCLAEVYLFSVLMTIVSVEMTNPSAWAFLPPDTFKANIECMPEWGLFTFLVAMWVSLVLNHAIVYFHRKAKDQDLSLLPRPIEPANYENLRLSLKSSTFPSGVITAMVVVWPVALLLALLLDTLRVRFLGFSGFGIDMMKETGASGELSVSLARLFPLLVESDPTHSVNGFGLFLICFGYALFILIAPPLCCLLCCFIWFAPLRQRHRQGLLSALRILNAWSTLEVLACTLVVIVLQLHRFFGAMSGMITFLPSWIGPLLKTFGASEEQATGFGVAAELEIKGFMFVFLASVLGMIVPRIVYESLLQASVFTSD